MRTRNIHKAALTDAVTPLEEAGKEIAYQAAVEGIVLLENDGCLPLKPGKIALYGAGAKMTIKGGTGSGEVNERHTVSILEGMEDAVAALEDEIARLDQQMGSSTDFLEIEKLSTQRKQLEDELEAKMEQWILLNEKKEKIDEMIKK